MALNGSNGKFLSANRDDEIVCLSSKAGEQEIIQVCFHNKWTHLTSNLQAIGDQDYFLHMHYFYLIVI